MRSLPRLRNRQGMAVAGATVVIPLAGAGIGLAAVRDRPEVAVVVLVFAAVAGGVVAALVYTRRLRARQSVPLVEQGDSAEAWFTESSLDGFPDRALETLLPVSDLPSRQRLHTAWVLAGHGHDAPWLERHLGLSREVAHVLAAAAQGTHRRPKP